MGKEKRTIAVVLAALAVTGCAATLTGANSAGGIVQVNSSTSDAFKTANAHCQTFGKMARITHTSILGDQLTFDCVAP